LIRNGMRTKEIARILFDGKTYKSRGFNS